jgi:hypothetical protein
MNTIGKILATKQDVETTIEKAVDKMADMIGKGFTHTDTRFDAVESRLGKIENLLIEEQKLKLESLETRAKRLEDALAVEEKVPRSKPPPNGGLCLSVWLPQSHLASPWQKLTLLRALGPAGSL